tara:strand:+ start:381 stop:1619 length:1239 start_codon:yes stop_codon:yes gene_type:complete
MIKFFLKFKNQLSIFFIFIASCSEETILYDEIEKEGSIQTITLPESNNKVYQAFPNIGSNSKLLFGDVKGSENLFSLVQMTLFSGNIPPTSLIDLLADSIQVDSAMVYFETADSLISESNLSLFSILGDQDSVFSDSTNYYSLENFLDYDNNSLFLGEISLSTIEPDSTGYDSLNFVIKDESLDDLKEYFFDTETYPARTFMLKSDNSLDQLFSIESSETANRGPKMRVWYKSFVDEETTIDTFITFFTQKDISVFKPPIIEDDDLNYISLNSGSGLRSIVEFDLSFIDSLSRNKIFKNSNLVLNVENSNLNENDEFYVIVTALQDSVVNWDFSSAFVDNEFDENYTSNANFIISRKIEENEVKIPIQAFLQGYKNGLFQYDELLLYSAPLNSPFDKVKFNLNAIEVLYVEP